MSLLINQEPGAFEVSMQHYGTNDPRLSISPLTLLWMYYFLYESLTMAGGDLHQCTGFLSQSCVKDSYGTAQDKLLFIWLELSDLYP